MDDLKQKLKNRAAFPGRVAGAFLLFFIGLGTRPVWAGGKAINVQGKLTDSAGNALTGSQAVMFRLYKSPTGSASTCDANDPNCVWSESQGVTPQNGLFNVTLGNAKPLDAIPFNTSYYLGMQVLGDDNELSPRQMLGASAYALGSLGDFSVGQNVVVGNSATIGGNATVGNNAVVNGRVGIGTSTPAKSLDIIGDIRMDNTNSIGWWNSAFTEGSGPNYYAARIAKGDSDYAGSMDFYVRYRGDNSELKGMSLQSNGRGSVELDVNGPLSVAGGIIGPLSVTGNVGIGVPIPHKALDVAGDIRMDDTNVIGWWNSAFTGGSGPNYYAAWISKSPGAYSGNMDFHVRYGGDNTERVPMSIQGLPWGLAQVVINGSLAVSGSVNSGAQKMCSAVVPGNFRDSISVPDTWTPATCRQWMAGTGASSYNLVCVFSNSFSMGGLGGGLPPQNCGW